MSQRRSVPHVAAIIGIAGLTLFGANSIAQAPSGKRPIVRFLIGSPGGFNQRGFVQEYAKFLPGIDLQLVDSARRGGTRLEEIQGGEADLVISTSHAAYLAYSGQQEASSQPFERLRA